MGKAPFVAMQTDLPKEVRVELIAEITGHDRDAVLGKLFRLWAWCTDRGLLDAPDDCDGYAVPERVIRQFLGERGVEAMLGDGCDELALGERRSDGLIYLRGTHETVSRLRALRSTAVTGGRSAAGGNRRGAGGRFVSNQQFDQPTVQPATSCGPADDQPASSREPAAASEIPQTTDHREEERTLSRAIPVVVPPSAKYDPDSPADRMRLAEQVYSRVNEAMPVVAAELGLSKPIPLPPVVPSSPQRAIRDLLSRVREEGAMAPIACDRVVESAIADARARRDPTFLGAKLFTEGGWAHARELIPGFRRPETSRSSPVARGDPRVGRVEPKRPEDYPEGDIPL